MAAAADQVTYEDLYGAGSAATGARPRSTSRRTASSGRRSSPTSSAGPRCGTTRCSSTARTRSPTTSRRSSTPPRARSRSTSSPPSRSTRRATRCSSTASCTRSSSAGDGTIAGALEATRPGAHVGLREDVRDARPRGRRAAPRPLAHQARAGGDDVPLRRRGDARPARPALHHRLPRRSASCCPASAPACATCRSTSSATSASASSCCATSRPRTPSARTRSPSCCARCSPYSLGVFVPPGWDTPLRRVLRLHARADLRGGRALVRGQVARRRAAGRVAARAVDHADGPAAAPSAPSAAWRCCAAASSASRTAPPARDPEAMAMLFDSIRRSVDPRRAPDGPVRAPVGVPRRRAVARAARQRRRPRRRRAAPSTSTSSCAAASRTGSTWSPAGSTRAARSPPGGCGRAATRGRCGAPAGCSAPNS